MIDITDIKTSVKSKVLIKDDFFKSADFLTDSRSRLISYTGGYSVVFPAIVNGEKWAFRCWHIPLTDVEKRYSLIGEAIRGSKLPYFCSFEYTENGLIVRGEAYPITRMKWVEGVNLKKYICKNYKDSVKMRTLANSFLEMITKLHQHKIAHGDLQHGNIMVDDLGHLFLVDYDSMYVPAMGTNYSDIITGLVDYQHPSRKSNKNSSEKLDYFSELIIYISILAISENPDLVLSYNVEDSESLLFNYNDFKALTTSKIYNDLISLKNDEIKILLLVLSDYLKEDNINSLSPFHELYKGLTKKTKINYVKCGNVDGIVYKNQETAVEWDVENFSKITINGVEIPKGTMNYSMKFTKNTDIVFCVINGLQEIKQRKRIKVIDKPQIKFSSDKKKLRKDRNGVEPLKLSWNVKNASSVSIVCEGNIISSANPASNIEVTPINDCSYELIAIGLDGKTEFKSTISIKVREPADVVFFADKTYTLQDVPITLSWRVSGARKIRLNNSNVPSEGKSCFISNKDEVYTLNYEDEFGIHSKKIEIKVLPLPVIESLFIETPEINSTVDISMPNFILSNTPNIPEIQLDFANLNLGEIPDLKEMEAFVEIPASPRSSIMTKISNLINKVFIRKTN